MWFGIAVGYHFKLTENIKMFGKSSSSFVPFRYGQIRQILFLLFVSHFIIWVTIPTLFEGSIRLDVAEGIINGPEWQLSYERHPPFSSWLVGIVWQLGSMRYLGLFALGQFLVLFSLAILLKWFRLTGESMSASAATLCFLLSPFATYLPFQINHNFGVMPFWVLTLYCSWNALQKNKLRSWILLGLVIGLGLWAKYAILHLVIPLVVLAIIDRDWRKRFFSFNAISGVFVSILVIMPHIVDVLSKGATTIKFATRTQDVSILGRFGYVFEFFLNTILYNALMAAIICMIVGMSGLRGGLQRFWINQSSSKLDRFVLVASIGPVAIILLAALFGVKPKILWLTPISISFVALWSRVAALAEDRERSHNFVTVFAFGSAFIAATYIALRLIVPFTNSQLAYSDMDGPRLAVLAREYWKKHMAEPIPYLVSFGEQRGRQAIGSIAFDLPYRTKSLEENDESQSPWIDIADLRRKGALVVAPRDMPTNGIVAGLPIEDVVTLSRPSLRHSKANAEITFGWVRPVAP